MCQLGTEGSNPLFGGYVVKNDDGFREKFKFWKAKPLNREIHEIREKAAVLNHGWDRMNTDEKPEWR